MLELEPDGYYMTRARAHEAAHGIAGAILFGAEKIWGVSVNGDGSGLCATATLPTDSDSVMRDLVMTLAGSALARAEGYGESDAELREIGCVGDMIHARNLAARLAESGYRPAWKILDEADAEALRLVEQHRDEIALLAESLRLAGDRLDGHAVQAALTSAFEGSTWRSGELAPRRLPASFDDEEASRSRSPRWQFPDSDAAEDEAPRLRRSWEQIVEQVQAANRARGLYAS